MTLIVFNTEYKIVWHRRPIEECIHIDTKIYSPEGGTALLDALGNAIVVTTKWIQ
jgi:hypothetical protein